MGMAMEHKMPLIVFDAMEPGNIARVAKGESLGTLIGS
jgi:uridylate kinase